MTGSTQRPHELLRVAVALPSRSVAPGDRCVGTLTLQAPVSTHVESIHVVPVMLRRLRDGDVQRVEELPVSAPHSLGAHAVTAHTPRVLQFTMTWPHELAASVPNQLDYDLVATAVTLSGEVTSRTRVLVLAAPDADNMTLPIGPAWASPGTRCELEEGGAWHPAKIESVHGLMVLVRCDDALAPLWVPTRRIRAVDGG